MLLCDRKVGSKAEKYREKVDHIPESCLQNDRLIKWFWKSFFGMTYAYKFTKLLFKSDISHPSSLS